MIGKLVLLAAMVWLGKSTANTAKTRNVEDRLNTAMPRIPWPQPYDGPAGNSSYPPGNSSYTSGNSSYPYGQYSSTSSNSSYSVRGGNSAYSDGSGSEASIVSTVGTLYAAFNVAQDTIASVCGAYNNHVGDYQNAVAALNTIRASYSGTVQAFNDHIADHGNLVLAVQTLRADHSNLLNNHNGLMFRLNAANILQ